METLKGQRRCHNASTSLIYQSAALFRTGFGLFLYGTFEFARLVQDLRFSCTKCSRFAISGQVCPLDLLVLLKSRCSVQNLPLFCQKHPVSVISKRFGTFVCRFAVFGKYIRFRNFLLEKIILFALKYF